MRYMKIFCCIVACLGALSLGANAETPIDISVNGTYIQLDAAPVIENGRTLVPVRALSNALDFDSVTWNAANKQVQIADNSTQISLQIGSKTATVNGNSAQMDTAAKLMHNKTYVPLRFLAEATGAAVNWNSRKYTAEIIKDGISVPASAGYTEDMLDWLARIVHAEAQGESKAGKVAVANVVLNRVDSNQFPDTIYGVIFDTQYGVQFTPVANGTIYNTPGGESYSAAKQAMHGRNEAGESLYFCNPQTSTSTWILQNRQLYRTIGKHEFYL